MAPTRAAVNRALLAEVRRIHDQHHDRYGAPRIHAALLADAKPGFRRSSHEVERLPSRLRQID